MVDLRIHMGLNGLTVRLLLMLMLIMCPSYIQEELGLGTSAYAQTPGQPITSSGLNTHVSTPIDLPNGKVQHDITGGIRPGNGTNLFHSFGEFNIPTNHTANFLNDSAIATSNILGRVTGDNPSSIFGTIQTTGFGNANLFLMNPSGIVFGPNASLNVGGSVTFTTANYLRLAEIDGTAGVFHADTAVSSILTSTPVTAFGFLSTPAGIAVQSNRLSVPTNQSISLVGGNQEFTYSNPDSGHPASVPAGITISGGQLSARSGQINVTSVASRGEVSAADFMPSSDMARGTIRLSQETRVDVSSDSGGTIRIRGGQLLITDATLSANTVNTDGASLAVDINATGDLEIADTRGVPAITAQSTGSGKAGEIRIVSANLKASTTTVLQSSAETFALVDTHASNNGKAGNITIETGNLNVTGPSGLFYFLDSGVQADGHGGNATITADTINLTGTTISTGAERAAGRLIEASGPSGNLTIDADSLRTSDAHLVTTATASVSETQRGGSIELRGKDINLGANTSVSAAGTVGGEIIIIADRLFTEATQLDTFTDVGPGKGIIFKGRILELTDGSTMSTSTFGNGKAGDITITATDHVGLLGITGANPQGELNPSGVFSNSFGFFGQGAAGNIVVTTPKLTLNEGRINTSTASSGQGGDVTIDAGIIEMFGEFPNTFGSDFFFAIRNIHPSGIFTQTVGSEFCTGPCGDAGHISLTTNTLSMGNGSQLNSGTTNSGRGGNITVRSTRAMDLSGTLTDGSPVGIFSHSIGTSLDSETGGNISLTARQSISVRDGAAVSASSAGPGDAGNISIDAGQQLNMEHSKITTEANQSKAGNINIQAIDLVRLVNGEISTSVRSGAGSGGNITIDPNVVSLQNNSTIFAQAMQGSGGNITITTPVFLQDPTSRVNADSQFGLNGSVTIQSPTSNLSGTVGQLAAKTSPPQVLLQNRCVALAGGDQSTFILAGRDALPSEPGGWLSSPLVMGSGVENGHEDLSRLTGKHMVEGKILSLRRLTPQGFLVRSFAIGPTGCHS